MATRKSASIGNLRLRTKLFLGFGMTGLLFAASVAFTMFEVGKSTASTRRTLEIYVPAVEHSRILASGMQHSMAALRGWMLLGEQQYKSERQHAWKTEIEPVTIFLKGAIDRFPQRDQRLAQQILEDMSRLKTEQESVEDIANTPRNIPAQQTLQDQGDPLYHTLIRRITSMINEESTMTPTPARRGLLVSMANVRGMTSMAMTSLRAFMVSGAAEQESEFLKNWGDANAVVEQLAKNEGLLNRRESVDYQVFQEAQASFQRVLLRIVALRKQKDWNRANTWLATIAAPESASIVQSIETLVGRLEATLHREGASAIASSTSLTKTLWLLLVIGLALAMGLGVILASSITKPIEKLAQCARSLAQGDIKVQPDFDSDNEIGVLAQSFRQMREANEAMALIAERLGQGDLSAEIPLRSDNDALGRGMRNMREGIRSLVIEVAALTEASARGSLHSRADLGKHSGAFRDLCKGINSMLDQTTRSTSEAATVLQQLAVKNFRVRVTGRYEGDHAILKNNLNQTCDVLNEAIREVATSAENIDATSESLKNESSQLTQATQMQATSVLQISQEIQALGTLTEETSTNAMHVKDMASDSQNNAETGQASMQELNEKLEQILGSADKTSDIIQTISQIAFQTNLLALNAAVEAARAGDAGLGFAVVADEVRALAQRTSAAAADTTRIVQQSVQDAQNGVDVGKAVASQLDNIVTTSAQVNEHIGEIARASSRQAEGLVDMNMAIHQIREAAEQNATTADTTANSAGLFSSQARRLSDLVARFQLRG